MVGWIISVLLPLAVGGLAGFLSMNSMSMYQNLVQPALAPPPWLFGVVWPILYILMGLASYLVFRSDAPPQEKKTALTLYAVQLFLNFCWPLLFFRMQNYLGAFLLLVLLILVLLATISRFAAISKRAAWLLVPYLLWTLFAGYLNFSIWLLNR